MVTVTTTISDEFGNVTNNVQTCQLDLETEDLDNAIEKAVVNFKNQMLSSLHSQLLEKKQKEFIQADNLNCDKIVIPTIKMLSGSVNVKRQRFLRR